ncbi:hypothetical protein BROSI_A3236 [Candidatus Brocadia sinica JPN1]|uniref:ArsR family transcriptional regulator n=2 Tax=Candidatus Brocadiaceae TaxID=1127830 RepID=A0ABQ0K1A2_9BACT|nr:hypothetical protein BROSI_A3236 [Candidatus Brocadia sinica JPN1]GJQ18899.1 MAG: hypothetical protein HBSIN01_28580 [Candidatus Brocadia sinica]
MFNKYLCSKAFLFGFSVIEFDDYSLLTRNIYDLGDIYFTKRSRGVLQYALRSLFILTPATFRKNGRCIMAEPVRITPKEVYQKLKSGTTLLVCAYDDETTFRQMKLQGAISLHEFKSRLPSLSKDQEIIFYCG